MNPETWVASGHVGGFADPLIDCKSCKARFRADHLIEEYLAGQGIKDVQVDGWSNEKLESFIAEKGIVCPEYGKADFTGIETAFSSIKTTFNKTVDNVYKVIESASGLLQVVNGDIPEVEKALDSTGTTIDEMITTFENVRKMMDNSKKTISRLLSRIDDIDSNEALVKLVMNIVDDPKALSSFFSEPMLP